MGKQLDPAMRRRPSLTLVTQFFDPDPSATAYFLSDIAYGLAERGWDVRVVTAQPSYEPGLPTCAPEETRRGVAIRRLALLGYQRTRLLGRLAAQASFTLAAAQEWLRGPSSDVVMVVTCPPFLSWLSPLARARNSAFVVLIHDVYPEVVSALGKAPAFALLGWAYVERAVLNRASLIITLGQCQADIVKGKLKAGVAAPWVIAHWAKGQVEDSKVQPRAAHPLLLKLGIEHKFVVQYSGNLGLFHGLEILPEVFSLLPPDVFHVLIVGGGQKRAWLEQQTQQLGLTHVTYLPHQSESELPTTLAACDVALVCLHPQAVGLCVPSKIYGSLAAGRAVCVVAPEHAEAAQTVTRYGCGVVAPYEAPAVASVLQRLAQDRAATSALGEQARACYEAHFQRSQALDRYAEALQSVADRTR